MTTPPTGPFSSHIAGYSKGQGPVEKTTGWGEGLLHNPEEWEQAGRQARVRERDGARNPDRNLRALQLPDHRHCQAVYQRAKTWNQRVQVNTFLIQTWGYMEVKWMGKAAISNLGWQWGDWKGRARHIGPDRVQRGDPLANPRASLIR